MPELTQEFATLPVDALEPHPENPNRGDVQVIAGSIEHNGFFGAVLVQAPCNGRTLHRVLGGEHRLMAAQAEGMAEVPVLVLDVDDDAARRIMLADNESARRAGYDDETLGDVLAALSSTPAGLAGTAFTTDDLDDLLLRLSPPPPPSLDELAAEHGLDDKESGEDWSRLVKVSLGLADFGRWTSWVAGHGDDSSVALVALLDAVDA